MCAVGVVRRATVLVALKVTGIKVTIGVAVKLAIGVTTKVAIRATIACIRLLLDYKCLLQIFSQDHFLNSIGALIDIE